MAAFGLTFSGAIHRGARKLKRVAVTAQGRS